jgi:hypothetical protein
MRRNTFSQKTTGENAFSQSRNNGVQPHPPCPAEQDSCR